MKLYEMVYITKEEGLFCNHNSEKTYWAINAKKNSKIVYSKKECKRYDTQYAIEHDTENMSLECLLDVMYKEMSVEQVKTICNNHEKLEQFFLAYLSGENIRKELAEIKFSAESAENSATGALALSLFK